MLAVFAASDHWLENWLYALARHAPESSFFYHGWNLRALLALILVSLNCGAVGSLVVGGRMAFFSDALAHCAFASVTIGFVLFSLVLGSARSADEFWEQVTPVMLVFGVLIGFSIAHVRERTGLASDTVIGVFFAAAIGLAATLRAVMQSRTLFTMEDFLFGDPVRVRGPQLVWLAGLVLFVAVVLSVIYNPLLLHGFSPSLALSRNSPSRFASYAFVVLLALVVNLCVRTVGALLINALLVVPAATAANVCRNLRQMFWLTLLLCLGSCLAGQAICWEVETRFDTRLGVPGTITLVSAGLFVLSALLGPRLRARPGRAA
jgi:zinc transport system permease protein